MHDDDNSGQYPLLGDLVPWPLLLTAFGAATAVLVIETIIGRQAGKDWWQASTQNLDKAVYIAFLTVIAGNTLRLAKEGFMWLRKEKARFRERVAAEVTAQVTEQVTTQVTEQVTAQVTEQVTTQVTEQVTALVTDLVSAQRDKAWNDWLKSQNITPPDTPPTLDPAPNGHNS